MQCLALKRAERLGERRRAAGGKPPTPAVERIPDDREARCAPDARGSGGCDRSPAATRTRVWARKRRTHPVVRHRRTTVAAHRHRVRCVRCRPMGSSMVPPPVMTPGAHREVLAGDLARSERRHERRVRLRRARHDEQPAGVLVQAMDEAGTRHQGELRIEPEERVLQGVARVAGPGCTTRPAGLLITSERAVPEHHGERQRLGGDPASPPAAAPRCAPAPRRAPGPWRAAAARPPATAPDSIHSFRRAREYCGSARARAWSKRRPAASGGSVSACERNSAGACGGRKGSRGIRYTGSDSRGAKPKKGPFQDVLVPSGARRRARVVYRCCLPDPWLAATRERQALTTRIPPRHSTRRRTRPWSRTTSTSPSRPTRR